MLTTHEPAVAVHNVFATAIPGAFGIRFLHNLIQNNMITDIQKTSKEMSNAMKVATEEFRTSLRNEFREALKHLFEAYPEVDRINFQCYTPYFNDGEECYFTCTADDARVSKVDDKDEDDMEYHSTARKDFTSFLGSITNEIYQMMFENHSDITISRTISRTDIKVEAYDHE
jgi:hypothetical protein